MANEIQYNELVEDNDEECLLDDVEEPAWIKKGNN